MWPSIDTTLSSCGWTCAERRSSRSVAYCLPDGSGIEATREDGAENPAIRVLMLTSYPDEEAAALADRAVA
jgi:DNA-binding NarL/FixJ family response regulator